MPGNAVRTNVEQTDASATILPPRSRQQLVVENHSDALMYLLYGVGTASATDHDICLQPQSSGFGAKWVDDVSWDGALSAVWASDGEGFARVLEVRS